MTAEQSTTLYPARDEVFYDRGVWAMGEEGEMGLLVEGHGRRALAAANAYERHLLGHHWREHEFPGTSWREVWVVVHETCGCTAEDHEENHRTEDGYDLCDCAHPGLPPCGDVYGWSVDYVDAGAPGAVAMTEVQW